MNDLKLEYVKSTSAMLYTLCETSQDLERRLAENEKEWAVKQCELERFKKITEDQGGQIQILKRDFEQRGQILEEKNKIIDAMMSVERVTTEEALLNRLVTKLEAMDVPIPKRVEVLVNGKKQTFIEGEAVSYEYICLLASIPAKTIPKVTVRCRDETEFKLVPEASATAYAGMEITVRDLQECINVPSSK